MTGITVVVKSGVFKETTSFLCTLSYKWLYKITPKISKQTKEIFRGVFFQNLQYQTEIKVDSTGSVF